MKSKKPIIWGLLLTLGFSRPIVHAQHTVVENVTWTTGVHPYCSPGTLISPSDPLKPVDISNTSQVDYTAIREIQLLSGFNAHGYSGTGYFHAGINSSNYDILVTPVNSQVPKYEKLEYSIKVDPVIQGYINNFVTHAATGTKLNPFDPNNISVEATFTSPTGIVKTIYGFYMEDFQYNGDPTNTATRWTQLVTDHKFKIRFAPDEIGQWKCSIVIQYPSLGQSYTFCDMNFDCLTPNPGNKGFVEVGNNGYFKFSETNETFFPIGAYLGWANWRWDNTGYNPFIQNPQTVRPAEYKDYERMLQVIKNSGGNYVRVILNSTSWGLEWEEVGNYYDRQPLAWELENVVKFCEDNDMYISLTMTHAGDFMDMDVNNYNQTSASNYGGIWDDNPYKHYLSTLPSNYQEPIDPTLFITDVNAKAQYKKFLRYMVSRWGYSTHIAKLEINGEANQIGHNFASPDYTVSYNAYSRTTSGGFVVPSSYQYKPANGWISPVTGHTYSYDLGQWTIEMASYIKNTLTAKQLITHSYALGPYGRPLSDDAAFSDPLIHTLAHHSGHDNFYGNVQRRFMVDQHKYYYGNKPFIIEECYPSSGRNVKVPGDPLTWDCPSYQNDADFHNAAWAMCFTKAAGTTPVLYPGPDETVDQSSWDPILQANWTSKIRIKQFWADNIPGLSAFMNGLDFQNQGYVAVTDPDYTTVTSNTYQDWQHEIEKFYLVGTNQAMGWVHLKRWYWATADDPTNGNICKDDNGNSYSMAEGTNAPGVSLPEDWYHGVIPSAQTGANMSINMPTAGTYVVEWYNTRTNTQVTAPASYTTVFGNFLSFPIPTLSAPTNGCTTCYPDLAFKLYLQSNGSFRQLAFNQNTTNDKPSTGILPNPSKGIFTVLLNGTIDDPTIEVFDATGNNVFKNKFSSLQNAQIDISSFSNGMYYVRISNEFFTETHKLIVEY